MKTQYYYKVDIVPALVMNVNGYFLLDYQTNQLSLDELVGMHPICPGIWLLGTHLVGFPEHSTLGDTSSRLP